MSWATKRSFDYDIDNTGNLLIHVPASQGREDSDRIIIQGHMDMVCVKDQNSNHLFETDSIEIIEEDGWIKGNKTSLGADNAIGVAIAMASVDLESHPALQILITVEEESGMGGALNLDFPKLSGRYLLNLDIQDQDIILVGSAGSVRFNINKKLPTSSININGYHLKLSGGKGGHSGLDAHKNRGQLNSSFFSFLLGELGHTRVSRYKGGQGSNVIPSSLELVFSTHDIDIFKTNLERWLGNFKENHDAEGMVYEMSRIHIDSIVDSSVLSSCLEVILQQKTGVQSMSQEIEGLVQTSINFGLSEIKDGIIKLNYMARSSSPSDLDEITDILVSLFQNGNYQVEIVNRYNGWEEKKENMFNKKVKDIYDSVTGENTIIEANHGGLEAGIIIDKIGADKIQGAAIGPNIRGAHTSKETCELKSVEIICKVVEKLLKKEL